MIRISCVSYLNAAPFIYGIRNSRFTLPVQLELDTPADCAARLEQGAVDVGLIPVAMIRHIPEGRIISNTCIGANGAVRSVTLLGDVPLTEMKTILLDYQSRTSVALAQILAREHWHIKPEWTHGAADFEQKIKGTTGGVVIGDRSLRLQSAHPFVYDLAEAWQAMTRLPFVFACWVANKPLPPGFETEFNRALELGLNQIAEVIGSLPRNQLEGIDAHRYLTQDISYALDAEKQKGMDLFLNYLAKGVS